MTWPQLGAEPAAAATFAYGLNGRALSMAENPLGRADMALTGGANWPVIDDMGVTMD